MCLGNPFGFDAHAALWKGVGALDVVLIHDQENMTAVRDPAHEPVEPIPIIKVRINKHIVPDCLQLGREQPDPLSVLIRGPSIGNE